MRTRRNRNGFFFYLLLFCRYDFFLRRRSSLSGLDFFKGSNNCPNRYGFIFLMNYLSQYTRCWRRHFRIHLVCTYLNNRLILLNSISFINQPVYNRSLFYPFTHLRHDYVHSHVFCPGKLKSKLSDLSPPRRATTIYWNVNILMKRYTSMRQVFLRLQQRLQPAEGNILPL